MPAPATIARKHIMALLEGTTVPVRYPLPWQMTRWERNIPLEKGEESAFVNRPYMITPSTEETGSQTTSDQDKDTRHIWKLRSGFLLGGSYLDLFDELEDAAERLRRLINTAMNWINHTDVPIENCIITDTTFLYAVAPDRRALIVQTIRCDVTDDWTVGF